MENMNILVFNYEFPPLGGGGGVFTLDVMRELAKKHNVHVITSGYDGFKKYEIVDNIKVHRVSVLSRKKLDTASIVSMLSYFPTSIIKGILLKQKFDIINSHFAIPTAPSSLVVSKLLRIPHILSLHGGDLYDPSKALSPHNTRGLHGTVEICINASHTVIAQSSNTRKNAYKYYNIKKDIEVIPLGIPNVTYNLKSRKELGIDKEDITLITIGRLVPRKALHKLLEIVSKINNKKVKLLIIGDGPEMEGLKRKSEDIGIKQQVVFTGKLSDSKKHQFLNIADIYVSTAMHEGFGLVYLEAMKYSLPIVTFDNGGHTDFLENNINGFLVSKDNTAHFEERLKELITDKNKAKAMGINNKEKFEQKFAIPKIAERYEELFYRTIKNLDIK